VIILLDCYGVAQGALVASRCYHLLLDENQNTPPAETMDADRGVMVCLEECGVDKGNQRKLCYQD
jgi:hypothetical protein